MKSGRNANARNARYLNVDLDIESKSPLKSLEKELGDGVVVMYSGRIKNRHCLFLETAKHHKNPDTTIHELCRLIEGLSPGARRLWDEAVRREFDIGYETRFSLRHANRFTVRPSTLRRVAKLSAGLSVTVYREDDTEPGKALTRAR